MVVGNRTIGFIDQENVSLDTKIMSLRVLEANISYTMILHGHNFEIQDGGFIKWINVWAPSFI